MTQHLEKREAKGGCFNSDHKTSLKVIRLWQKDSRKSKEIRKKMSCALLMGKNVGTGEMAQ